MDIDFDIMVAHRAKCDEGVMKEIIRIGRSVLDLSADLSDYASLYPRDIFTEIGGIIYINPIFFKLEDGKNEIEVCGRKIKLSPYGEGGRVLETKAVSCEEIILIGSQVIFSEENCTGAMLDEFDGAALRIGCLPVPLLAEIPVGVDSPYRYFIKDHLDLAMALVVGEDGKFKLLVDEETYAVEIFTGHNDILSPEESMQKIREVCRRLDIEVVPVKVSVPLGLNLVQFEGGRILMSGGDDDLYEILKGIVGKDKVIRTEIPIRLYPICGGGGIRCMTNHISGNWMRDFILYICNVDR